MAEDRVRELMGDLARNVADARARPDAAQLEAAVGPAASPAAEPVYAGLVREFGAPPTEVTAEHGTVGARYLFLDALGGRQVEATLVEVRYRPGADGEPDQVPQTWMMRDDDGRWFTVGRFSHLTPAGG